MALIPLEFCENVEIKNSNNETRIIGYNNPINCNFIGCYYIKDKQVYHAGDVCGYYNATNWLDGKDILLLL